VKAERFRMPCCVASPRERGLLLLLPLKSMWQKWLLFRWKKSL
jgi:hypothetical protein